MSDNGHSTEETMIRFNKHNSGIPKGTNYCANGGGGFTGKWRGAKGGFLEGGIRVPAIISYPGHPEEVNYANEHPEIVERLSKLHEKWAAEVFN